MLADTDSLIKLAVFVLFFLVPVIKSIRDAKKKQRDAQSRRDERPTTDANADSANEGRQAWEALLRGELLTETRKAPSPPPAVEPVERRVRRSFEESSPETPYTPSMEGQVASLPERGLTSEGSSRERRIVLTDSEPLTRTRALTETEALTNAPALTDAEPLTNAAALTDTPSTEGIPIAKLVAQGAFQDLGDTRATGERPAPRAAIARTRADWRRALVASEVLGAPVSMRPWGAGAPRVSGGRT